MIETPKTNHQPWWGVFDGFNLLPRSPIPSRIEIALKKQAELYKNHPELARLRSWKLLIELKITD